MKLQRAILRNFRNYKSADVVFSDGINVFLGKNAQGKTNIIEALYFACVGRSPRTSKDKELIMFDCPDAYVDVRGETAAGPERIEIYINRSENKRISINQTPVLRIGELLGTIGVVFFSPEELKIVKDGPADRRRFLDIDISQLSKNYFYSLNRYNKALSQRNRLLKSGKADEGTLFIWDEQLASAGADITAARRDYVNTLAQHARLAQEYLTDGKESLVISYEGIEGETAAEIKAEHLKLLAADRERDIRNGYTCEGAHKDDIKITVNGSDLRIYGSQGQLRTAALALKLAEIEVFKAMNGEYPVLILDDVLSELDEARARKLIERVSVMQTFITGTDFPYAAECIKFTVAGGSISRQA